MHSNAERCTNFQQKISMSCGQSVSWVESGGQIKLDTRCGRALRTAKWLWKLKRNDASAVCGQWSLDCVITDFLVTHLDGQDQVFLVKRANRTFVLAFNAHARIVNRRRGAADICCASKRPSKQQFVWASAIGTFVRSNSWKEADSNEGDCYRAPNEICAIHRHV